MKLRETDQVIDSGVWTSTLTNENTFFIPDELLEKLNWKSNTHVYYEIKEGALIIRKDPN